MAGAGTPSGRIIAAAEATVSVVDASGRRLEVRRPGALDRLRLFKAVGAGLSQNSQYLGYAMLAMCVVAIDEVPMPQPQNEAQMEAMVGRLGDVGMVAVGQALADARAAAEGGGEGVAEAEAGNGSARAG